MKMKLVRLFTLFFLGLIIASTEKLFPVTKYVPSVLVIEPEGNYNYNQKLNVNSNFVIQAFMDSRISVSPNYDEKMRLKGFVTISSPTFYFNYYLHSPNTNFSDFILKRDTILTSSKGLGDLIHIGTDVSGYNRLENYYALGNTDVYLYLANRNIEPSVTIQPPDWNNVQSYSFSIASADLNPYNAEEDEFIYILVAKDITAVTFNNYDRILDIEGNDVPNSINCNDKNCIFVITNLPYVQASLTEQVARLLASLGYTDPNNVYQVYTGSTSAYINVTLADGGNFQDKDGDFWGGLWTFPPAGLTFFNSNKVELTTSDPDYDTFVVKSEFYNNGYVINCRRIDGNEETISTLGSICVAVSNSRNDYLKFYSNKENPDSYLDNMDFYSLSLNRLLPASKLSSFSYYVNVHLKDFGSLNHVSNLDRRFFTPYVLVNSEPDIYGYIYNDYNDNYQESLFVPSSVYMFRSEFYSASEVMFYSLVTRMVNPTKLLLTFSGGEKAVFSFDYSSKLMRNFIIKEYGGDGEQVALYYIKNTTHYIVGILDKDGPYFRFKHHKNDKFWILYYLDDLSTLDQLNSQVRILVLDVTNKVNEIVLITYDYSTDIYVENNRISIPEIAGKDITTYTTFLDRNNPNILKVLVQENNGQVHEISIDLTAI